VRQALPERCWGCQCSSSLPGGHSRSGNGLAGCLRSTTSSGASRSSPRSICGRCWCSQTLAIGIAAAGVLLFLQRDIGGQIRIRAGAGPERRPRRLASFTGSRLLKSVFARSLGALAVPIASWGLGLALYTAALTAILQQAQRNLLDLLETVGRFNRCTPSGSRESPADPVPR
jgi:hypothetical protein